MRATSVVIRMLAALSITFAIVSCQSDAPEPQNPVPPPVAAQPGADRVLTNGKILTVDQQFSIAEAIAIDGDRIVAVGSNEDIASFVDDTTDVVDLAGRTVIPGLIDNHMHFIRAVQRWNLQARIDGINIRQQALDVIAAKAASMEPGEWLMVQGGWRENQFADQRGGFTLEELDAAAPNNPLFLQITYQTVYANTLALEAVGVSPEQGAQHRGPPMISGQPPYGLLNEQMPPVPAEQLEINMFDFVRELNKAGLTSVYDVGRPPEGDISLVAEMNEREPLPIRVWHTLKYQAYDPAGADAAIELIRASSPGTSNDYYGLLGLGEHVYLPFFDNPGTNAAYSDEIIDNFMRLATAAAEQGLPVHEHTMADVTVRSLLGPLAVLNGRIPLAPLRWSLAHVFTIEPETIDRVRDLGLTLAIHSVAMYGTPERQPPLRTIQDSGIVWGLGTDATIVAHYQPFITLGWAVSGRSINGDRVIDEPVSREEALIAHTRSNAWLMFRENDIGTLEAGKLADLVVLNRDYMTIPADEIFNIESVMTMVGGRVVYDTL